METYIYYGVYAVFVLLHRFYLRYITYYISAHWRFAGKILSQFKSEAKTKGYSGHNLRVALWETYYLSEKSQIAFYFNTTFLPFLYGLAYTSIFYLFV